MYQILLFAACACVFIVFSICDSRRIALHRNRNRAGDCATCAAPLKVWFIRQIPYRYSKTGPATKVDVCVACFDRYRKRRWLLWIGIALSPVGLIMLLKLIHGY